MVGWIASYNPDYSYVGDDSHLLAVCDVTVVEFELLCGGKIQRYGEDGDDETDSEWEAEEN